MSSVNKVIIVGRLGNDPESRSFHNGGGVTHISVATSERWTDKNTGERREQTEWHRISLFNRLGEIAAQYLRKGSMVYIEGSLHTRKYTDQQGIERYSTEIRASEMRMLGGNDRGDYQGGNYNAQNNYNAQGFANKSGGQNRAGSYAHDRQAPSDAVAPPAASKAPNAPSYSGERADFGEPNFDGFDEMPAAKGNRLANNAVSDEDIPF